ncbi:MAG: hypothetical protein H3C34_03350 [Caldilineaceae bacterium]|nr:hypothetical protein [Caldilineaceae bacterium]
MAQTTLDLVINGTQEACQITVVSAQGVVEGKTSLSVASYLHELERVRTPTTSAVEAIGRALYLALPEEVRAQIPQQNRQTDLNLRLDLASMALATLPWEYMHNGRAFLSLSPDVTLARRLDGFPLGPHEGDLRVLAAMPLWANGTEERMAEKRQLAALLANQVGVRVDFLDEASGRVTLAAIQRELRRSRAAGDPYHVLHLGCEIEDDEAYSPHLVLENELGERQRAGIDQLKWCAADHALQLILFGGTVPPEATTAAATLPAAAELAQVCAGAVVVPRFPLPTAILNLFATEVYLAMADGYTVDAAVAEGRRALVREAGEQSVEWAAPVLFMRGPRQEPAAAHAPATAAVVDGSSPAAPATLQSSAIVDSGASQAAESKGWWRDVPLELWIALLGAATTILVALIPVTVELVKSLRASPDAVAAVVASPTPKPSLAAYDIGAIVAGFQLPDDGSVDPAVADLQIERFYLQLQDELQESMRPLRFRAGLLGPDVAGRITGTTADDREQHAAQLAVEYGADLVVYGIIGYNDVTRQLEIQPEYYVLAESFADALEMTGSFRFGSPIGIAMPINRGLGVERELSARAASLAQIMVGLSLYLLEHDYQGALTAFETAASLPGWESLAGREVVDLLIGNAHLAMAVEAAARCDRSGVLAGIEQALHHFDGAATTAPGYARAYAGRASAHYLAALWMPEDSSNCLPESIDAAQLQLALADIAAAQQASEQPKEIGVRSRMLLTEAQVRFLEWLSSANAIGDPSRVAELPFWPVTEKVLSNYEGGDHPSVGLVASDARILRGQTYFVLGDCWSAEDEFDGALAVTEMPAARRMEVWGLKGDCFVELNQISAASDAYNRALQIARQLGRADDVAYFEAVRRQLSEPAAP